MKKIYLSATITSFVLSVVFTSVLLPILKRLKAGQNILSYVEEHKSKSGTPTMGGIGFVLAATLSSIVFMRGNERTGIVVLTIGVSYLAVGFIDDFLKLKHKENLGLKAWQKIVFQTLVAVFAGIYAIRAELTGIRIPFTGKSVELGKWYLPFAIFVYLSSVNCVNLTDGLDGLATCASLPFFAFLGFLSLSCEGNMSLICFCLCGALLAYLIFNVSPASVFMGDTGSLSLGGFAATLALMSGNALYIPILGVCFVLSGISVILQVIYYKATKGKRIFLMAPFHHHLQKKGYSESRISCLYGAISIVAGLICMF